MCYQEFTYFGCAHAQLMTALCPTAQAVDVSFWQPTLCSEYSSHSKQHTFSCGTGQFYCKDTPAGAYTERAYQEVASAEARLAFIEMELQTIKVEVRQFVAFTAQQGVPHELRVVHPVYIHYRANYDTLVLERPAVVAVRDNAAAIIAQAKAHFTAYTDLINNGGHGRQGPAYPPFAPVLANPQQGMQLPSPELSTSGSGLRRRPFPTSTHLPRGLVANERPRLAPATMAAANAQQYRAISQQNHRQQMQPPMVPSQDENPPRKPSPIKGGRRRRPAVQADADDSPQPEDTGRRSLRRRVKKVNYAESLTSDRAESREPSPAKSDAGFSPDKSDVSTASPVKDTRSKRSESDALRGDKPNLRVPATSLKEKMSEYQRKRDAQQSAPSSTPMQPRRSMPGMKDILNSPSVLPSPKKTTLTETTPTVPRGRLSAYNQSTLLPKSSPPTIDRPGLQTSAFMDFSRPEPSQHFTNTPTGGPNATVPPFHGPGLTYARTPQSAPAPAAYPGYRNYSTPHQQQGTPTFFHKALGTLPTNGTTRSDNTAVRRPARPGESPYDQMRRSFSSTANLLPPSVPAQTPESVDPKKRCLPPSSPQESSAKRMRLSLPGYDTPSAPVVDDSSWLAGQSVTLDPPFGAIQRLNYPAEQSQVPSPAPVFAPEAVAFQREQSRQQFQLDAENETQESEETGEGLDDLAFSDNIEWPEDDQDDVVSY